MRAAAFANARSRVRRRRAIFSRTADDRGW
jgi:hypothetical protein